MSRNYLALGRVDQVYPSQRGLVELSKRGVQYPIIFYGPQMDPCSGIPPVYLEYLEMTNQSTATKK